MDDFLALYLPFATLFSLPYVDLESVREHPLPWLCAAFYTITPIWAGISAHRLEFHKYRLGVARDVPSALFGSFLFWPYCFLSFLKNRSLVLSGKAELKAAAIPDAKPTRNAWPAVAAWLLYWGIVLSIALPGHRSNPRRANEASAVTCLKQYAAAQAAYRSRFGTRYCADFRILFYGPDDKGRPLELISKGFADAFVRPPSASSPPHGRAAKPVPYQGYVFCEDPYVADNSLWDGTFALVAYPAKPGRTGNNLYWIGEKGDVYSCGIPEGQRTMPLITADESPLHPESVRSWHTL